MFWIKDAPTVEDSSPQEIEQFIDDHITCYRPTEEDDPKLQELVGRQMHKHSHTCKKGNHDTCRFHYPMPPMKQTMLLDPLDEEYEGIDEAKELWTKIQKTLIDMKYGEQITFATFLEQLQVSEQQYIQAIRSSIKTTTIFLKRSPFEIRVNPYNKYLLLATQANMDIQYIFDVYACARYIASYVTKGQRGMSELLRKACADVRGGNTDVRQQLRHISNKFLNAVEISAQEAAYILLQLPMRKSSRQVLFVNTNMPQDRVFLLKPQHVLDSMKDDDDDIMTAGLIQHYERRPKSLEKVSLAEYAAWYSTERKPSAIKRQTKSKTADGYLPEVADDDNEDDLLPNDAESEEPTVPRPSTVQNEHDTMSEPNRRKVCMHIVSNNRE